MALRDKFLYLDYPSINFAPPGTEQSIEETDIEQLLKHHFTARLEKPEDATKIATELLSIYSKKGKTSHQEALNVIDKWKPND